jgi:hypothetical protein
VLVCLRCGRRKRRSQDRRGLGFGELENNDLGNGVTFAVHGSSSDKDGFSIFRMIME